MEEGEALSDSGSLSAGLSLSAAEDSESSAEKPARAPSPAWLSQTELAEGSARPPLEDLAADVDETLAQARAELERQKALNAQLQTQLSRAVAHEPQLLSGAPPTEATPALYAQKLRDIGQLRRDLRELSSSFKTAEGDLSGQLARKQRRRKDLGEKLEQLKAEVWAGLELQPEPAPELEEALEAFHERRRQLLGLRAELADTQRALAEAQPASGLQLIDFEKLKIENQSLSKKIEERAEEIHRLQTRSETALHTLVHVREKLECERCAAAALAAQHESVDAEFNARAVEARQLRAQLKDAKEKFGKLTQATGIVNNTFLKGDFLQRKGTLAGLAQHRTDLRAELEEMERVIARWRLLKRHFPTAAP